MPDFLIHQTRWSDTSILYGSSLSSVNNFYSKCLVLRSGLSQLLLFFGLLVEKQCPLWQGDLLLKFIVQLYSTLTCKLGTMLVNRFFKSSQLHSQVFFYSGVMPQPPASTESESLTLRASVSCPKLPQLQNMQSHSLFIANHILYYEFFYLHKEI